MIGPRVGVRGPNPLRPDKAGVNAAKQARESYPPKVILDWAKGLESANKFERSRLTIFDESVK
jgi:hypothetical protein